MENEGETQGAGHENAEAAASAAEPAAAAEGAAQPPPAADPPAADPPAADPPAADPPFADAPAAASEHPPSGNGTAEAPSAAAEAPIDFEPPVEQELAAVQAEAGRLREQLLRTAADFDNFRKRTRREMEDAQRRGRESAIKDLLPVFDNLERAAMHAEGSPDVKSVADGLRIVLKQFHDTLEKMGVRRVPGVGTPFDPSVHEAIQQLESAEHPAGVVLAEVQPGYTIGDYLLRAALVVVSKGPPGGEPVAS